MIDALHGVEFAGFDILQLGLWIFVGILAGGLLPGRRPLGLAGSIAGGIGGGLLASYATGGCPTAPTSSGEETANGAHAAVTATTQSDGFTFPKECYVDIGNMLNLQQTNLSVDQQVAVQGWAGAFLGALAGALIILTLLRIVLPSRR